MLKCAICGKEFNDTQLDEYAEHVQKCAAEESLRRKTKDMEKINHELEEVKRAKVVYEGLRDQFKEKYPDIYKANFSDKCKENCKCSLENDNKSVNKKSLSFNKSSSKTPVNKEIYDDEFEFDVDFSDIKRILNELFGFDYEKRN